MAEEKEPTPEEVAQKKSDAAFKAASPPAGSPLMAARIGDPHICPMITGVVPHVGGPIVGPGCPTVIIGGMVAAVVSDKCICAGGPDVIAKGSATVLIGGKPAVRMMDQTAHGGMIIKGCPTVLIGG